MIDKAEQRAVCWCTWAHCHTCVAMLTLLQFAAASHHRTPLSAAPRRDGARCRCARRRVSRRLCLWPRPPQPRQRPDTPEDTQSCGRTCGPWRRFVAHQRCRSARLAGECAGLSWRRSVRRQRCIKSAGSGSGVREWRRVHAGVAAEGSCSKSSRLVGEAVKAQRG